MLPATDSALSNTMDSFHFGSPPTKTEDAMDVPFSSFDDDLDHRKRRRNRTTQSCWSCHQAKRKCDRKRPCSRCIQLGLTGLCVYETDDPTSRDDPSLTETQRLRKRIAELEALVREMKNKPHPRWADKVQSGNIGVDKWHTRAKYVVGNGSTSPNGGPGGFESFDDASYRFPPLDGSNGYDTSFSSNGTVLPPPQFDDSRRLSIASSVSSSSSPRTPYSYHTNGHQHQHDHNHNNNGMGMHSNPCTCLTAAPSTARQLAAAIRSVVLDSGITHPYSEGCKVLALVRELEAVADGSPISATATTSPYYPGPTRADPHSNSGSPHPPSSGTSSTSSPMSHTALPTLPHPLHAITPPTPPARPHISYYPTISTLTSLTYGTHPHSHHAHAYNSPGSDDGSTGHSHSHSSAPTTVPSMAYTDFGVGAYPSPHSASPGKTHGHQYPLVA